MRVAGVDRSAKEPFDFGKEGGVFEGGGAVPDQVKAKALAHPPVAAEWCLPLVWEGGAVVLWIGPTAELDALAAASGRVGGELEESQPGFAVVRKTGQTPAGFPRRPGMAKKRPLA